MQLKGIYKDKSPVAQLGVLLLLIFTSVILHLILGVGISSLINEDSISLFANQNHEVQESVNHLKLMQFFSSLGLFVTPFFLYSYLTNFNFRFTRINRQSIILVVSIMMLIIPFISFLHWLNSQIPFSEWIINSDNNSESKIFAILKMYDYRDLVYNLLLIAVIPAIGEELVFRGYLQQKFSNWFKNPHTSILMTALLFSAIHFHFQGVIPRFFLGVLLGYLYYWSRSLWLPILAHFTHNALVIVTWFISSRDNNKADFLTADTTIDINIIIFSIVAVTFLLYLLHNVLNVDRD